MSNYVTGGNVVSVLPTTPATAGIWTFREILGTIFPILAAVLFLAEVVSIVILGITVSEQAFDFTLAGLIAFSLSAGIARLLLD